MNKNAIILAAGKSSRFAPFTYEKPKGLFRVKGEILVERQIEQLLQAGISDIKRNSFIWNKNMELN